MLLTYPWHSKVWLLGCITNTGHAKRLLYKGQEAISANKLGNAADYFARAAQAARRAKDKHLEMTAVYAAAMVAEAQFNIPRADEYITYAATIAEPLAAEGDAKAEDVLHEKERIRELIVQHIVESKLKCIRVGRSLANALADAHGDDLDAREDQAALRLLDEAQAAINEALGYRHWLTAVVLGSRATYSDGADAVRMLQQAHCIALEYPTKAGFVLKGIQAKLREMGEDGEGWKLASV